MRSVRTLAVATSASVALVAGACAQNAGPVAPTPAPVVDGSIANAYILPGAVDLGPIAFGGEPVVVYTGERLRWRNLDLIDHDVVADTGSLPEFATTGILGPGADRTFTMNTVGSTTIHCSIHPQMIGTLIVREREPARAGQTP